MVNTDEQSWDACTLYGSVMGGGKYSKCQLTEASRRGRASEHAGSSFRLMQAIASRASASLPIFRSLVYQSPNLSRLKAYLIARWV
jgi:hypothetical protein